MFTLISSDATELFKKNIREILCQPIGYVAQLRYDKDYVSERILSNCSTEAGAGDWLRELRDAEALIVYAQTPRDLSQPFQFVPVRRGYVVAIRQIGTVIYIEVQLGGYPDLTGWVEGSQDEKDFVAWLAGKHHPLVAQKVKQETLRVEDDTSLEVEKVVGRGTFFDLDRPWKQSHVGSKRSEDERWQSVVDCLARLASMRVAIFFRVIGFYVACRRLTFHGPKTTSKVCKMESRFGVPSHLLPMGKPVDLRLVFYRPRHTTPQVIEADFIVEFDEAAFSKIPSNKISLRGRYDEVAVRLVTKRVFDSVAAPVVVRLSSKHGPRQVPEPLLMTAIVPPRWMMWGLIPLSLVAIPILVGISADDIRNLASLFGLDCPHVAVCRDASATSWLAKLVGALLTGAVGFIAFRRLPSKGG
jgi:hypothetical protein